MIIIPACTSICSAGTEEALGGAVLPCVNYNVKESILDVAGNLHDINS